jgi:hypothetical protein
VLDLSRSPSQIGADLSATVQSLYPAQSGGPADDANARVETAWVTGADPPKPPRKPYARSSLTDASPSSGSAVAARDTTTAHKSAGLGVCADALAAHAYRNLYLTISLDADGDDLEDNGTSDRDDDSGSDNGRGRSAHLLGSGNSRAQYAKDKRKGAQRRRGRRPSDRVVRAHSDLAGSGSSSGNERHTSDSANGDTPPRALDKARGRNRRKGQTRQSGSQHLNRNPVQNRPQQRNHVAGHRTVWMSIPDGSNLRTTNKQSTRSRSACSLCSPRDPWQRPSLAISPTYLCNSSGKLRWDYCRHLNPLRKKFTTCST